MKERVATSPRAKESASYPALSPPGSREPIARVLPPNRSRNGRLIGCPPSPGPRSLGGGCVLAGRWERAEQSADAQVARPATAHSDCRRLVRCLLPWGGP